LIDIGSTQQIVESASLFATLRLPNLRAWQSRDPLRLNEQEKFANPGDIAAWSVPVGVGVVSLVWR